MNSPPCFAVVPAAGHGLRMRPQNKLLLQWNQRPLIDHVLQAWAGSLVKRVVVVVRKSDAELQDICRAYSAVDLIVPETDPEDMKRSIQCGLRHIQATYRPAESDRWLVAPADLPTLGSDLINQIIAASKEIDSIVVPRFGDRQGHPVCFPWRMLDDVFALESDQGINHLVASGDVRWLQRPAAERPTDIDTPEDFRKLCS